MMIRECVRQSVRKRKRTEAAAPRRQQSVEKFKDRARTPSLGRAPSVDPLDRSGVRRRAMGYAARGVG